MENIFTRPQGELIEKAFSYFFPGSSISRHNIDAECKEVEATIQGEIRGVTFESFLKCVSVAKRRYTICRSGTGLTIKFV